MSEQTVVITQARTRSSFTPAVSGLLQRACACGKHSVNGGECAECRKKRLNKLQRAATDTTALYEAPPVVNEVLRSPGRPLDPATRAFMEPRFGHDFSQVRVHTDAKAAESAWAVNALAYTSGQEVVFGSGQYLPGTTQGRKLIAHELAHVVQQSNSSVGIHRQLGIGAENNPSEAQADSVAEQVTQESESEVEGYLDVERVMGVLQPVGIQIQRKCKKSPPAVPYSIDVNFNIPSTPTPNHTHNTAWISNRANDPNGQTAGLTEFSSRLRWNYRIGRDGNRAWVNSFSARFDNPRIRIYLTNQYPVSSCEYNDVLRHEQQHDTDFRTNAAQSEAWVCDTATSWPSRARPWHDLSNSEIGTLINEWMAFEEWQLDYDNWHDGCIWDIVDYPRMYAGCPGVNAPPDANCDRAPQRPVLQGLPLPQRTP